MAATRRDTREVSFLGTVNILPPNRSKLVYRKG